jgi:hypothetical protein
MRCRLGYRNCLNAIATTPSSLRPTTRAVRRPSCPLNANAVGWSGAAVARANASDTHLRAAYRPLGVWDAARRERKPVGLA